eukprot:gnl/Hemi2/12491_TR4257_c0_g1_i1.p1 gnl/Hemi2/12491_TR4257_c0_g1~~gnl/Hemi2/12491_TR4257_c0_g1_i1.p1  ORF type:complete len:565 (+),score=157.60 gnl/Hemi2/12491_TR4257_c0_g1_i1:45-1739(+)
MASATAATSTQKKKKQSSLLKKPKGGASSGRRGPSSSSSGEKSNAADLESVPQPPPTKRQKSEAARSADSKKGGSAEPAEEEGPSARVDRLLTELAVASKQIAALDALMLEVKREATTSLEVSLFERVVRGIVVNPNCSDALLNHFAGEFLQVFDDVRYYTLKYVKNVVSQHITAAATTTKEQSQALATNVFGLLRTVNMPTTAEELNGWFAQPPPSELEAAVKDNEDSGDAKKKKKRKRKTLRLDTLKAHKKCFGECWLAFLRLDLPLQVYKGVLASLETQVMPHMPSPLHLCGFLTDSYNSGNGLVSLLALNGLWELMSKHGLEYPDFYKKLYSLFTPQTLYRTGTRKRFFRLAELFLCSSSHLPSTLVKAFAKRISRLCLFCPSPHILMALGLIHNIILRHPACVSLIHRDETAVAAATAGRQGEEEEGDTVATAATTTTTSTTTPTVSVLPEFTTFLKGDPFIETEADPTKSNAESSFLWELLALKDHYEPSVSRFAAVFELPFALGRQKYDVPALADISYQTMFGDEIQRRSKTNALAFKPPAHLLQGHHKAFDCWRWS